MSAFATANGLAVVHATVHVPRAGNWHADLVVDALDAAKVSGAVALSMGDGQVTMQGTAIRAAAFADLIQLRMVGGAGTLHKATVTPKSYQGVPLRLPLGDLVTGAGEALSPASDAGLLSTQLTAWAWVEQPAGAALLSLLRAVSGATWRMGFDGQLWVGFDTWAEADAGEHVLIRQDEAPARLDIAAELPSLLPGTTYNGKRLSSITHHIDPSGFRTSAYYEVTDA